MDRVATTAVVSLFPNGFFALSPRAGFLEIGLCGNSINQIKSNQINVLLVHGSHGINVVCVACFELRFCAPHAGSAVGLTVRSTGALRVCKVQ